MPDREKQIGPYAINWEHSEKNDVVMCSLVPTDGKGPPIAVLMVSNSMLDKDPAGMQFFDDLCHVVDQWLIRLMVAFGAEEVEVVDASGDGFEA